MSRKSSRRDFLGGKIAADASGDAEAPGPSPVETPAESYLIRISRPAMACRFELLFNAGQYPNDTEAALEALDLVEHLERQMSYFRPTGELGRLNVLAGDGPVEVEPRLFELLEMAIDLSTATDGAFDIASAPVWEAWGFARRRGTIPTEEQLREAVESAGSRWVELDRQRKTVRFLRPGVRLSLGSIGKGYALDRAAEILAAAAVHDFLFHGGQSSVLARGTGWGFSNLEGRGACRAEQEPQTRGLPRGSAGASPSRNRATLPGVRRAPSAARPLGWTVGIRHPLHPARRLGEIRLRDRAIGTSGSTMQFFRHQGNRYGHILDPRTGRPAEGVLAVTVVAPTATLADALSTAFFVMGPERTEEFCRARPEIGAVLVCPEGTGKRFRLHVVGLREDDFVLLDGA